MVYWCCICLSSGKGLHIYTKIQGIRKWSVKDDKTKQKDCISYKPSVINIHLFICLYKCCRRTWFSKEQYLNGWTLQCLNHNKVHLLDYDAECNVFNSLFWRTSYIWTLIMLKIWASLMLDGLTYPDLKEVFQTLGNGLKMQTQIMKLAVER